MPYKLSPGTRVLKMRRISRDSEDSSALARQAEALDGAVGESRFDVVGDVEDSFISGAVRPEERPGLGRWMREPLWYEWDAIMVTSLDRITRNQTHWEMFADKCYQGGKDVICLDDPALDITPGNGRMIAYIKATQAQEYREAIVQKRRNQTQYYRDECLWGGGTWPFGYRPVLTEYQGRQRYKLLIDRVTGPLIREAYERIAEQGWSMSRLCQDWNERGVLTSQDYRRSVNGAEKKAGVKTAVKGSKWTTSTLGKMLKKPILKGSPCTRASRFFVTEFLFDGLIPSSVTRNSTSCRRRYRHWVGIVPESSPMHLPWRACSIVRAAGRCTRTARSGS
ncbi:recombinase family protein [Streptomyces virginiae]|uniref:recombinase family protein n=1 Tax=Streptomyces virginiae TaxID=1961 RepID=UPI002255BF1F|nr:recombinase family protein [Streptomyces virginiae]MCX4962862.1 recombinase family protein [Streptomyces virginiae]